MNQFALRIPKSHLYLCAMCRSAQNRSLKKGINGYGFWAICSPQNRYIKLTFDVPDDQAWFYNVLYAFFENFKN